MFSAVPIAGDTGFVHVMWSQPFVKSSHSDITAPSGSLLLMLIIYLDSNQQGIRFTLKAQAKKHRVRGKEEICKGGCGSLLA